MSTITFNRRTKVTNTDLYNISGSTTTISYGSSSGGSQDLQSVTTIGNKTSNAIVLEKTDSSAWTIDVSNGHIILSGPPNKALHVSGDVVAYSSLSPPAASWWDQLSNYVDGSTVFFINNKLSATGGGGSVSDWGDIDGTLSDQTDLWSNLTSKDTSIAWLSANKAASSHNHSAANITSGTLPTARGGTNQTSWTANRLVYNNSTTSLSSLAAITANRALISNASGLPTHSTVTNTELGYVAGVTSSIQTQLNGKANNLTYSASGNRWDVHTIVGGDGVMEVGKYLDFHESDGNTSDYSARLTSEGGQLYTDQFSANRYFSTVH
ncbi:MAG: hypothetical protein HC831_07760 [Chloroflexia bacterium]|nr:hypothetical protein [Chloroflexia bacterium]